MVMVVVIVGKGFMMKEGRCLVELDWMMWGLWIALVGLGDGRRNWMGRG